MSDMSGEAEEDGGERRDEVGKERRCGRRRIRYGWISVNRIRQVNI